VRGRLNLTAVEASLRHVQWLIGSPAGDLSTARDPLDDRVVANMLAGYALVDALVAKDVDVLAMGQLRHLLEMNTLVLCGTDPVRRQQYARHLQATERRFYEEPGGGIEDLVEWHARHRRDAVWDLAAGACARIMSKPQLFVEGNHRTAALVMSYLLLRAARPPFVLAPTTVVSYFELSSEIRSVDKSAPGAFLPLAGIAHRLAALLSRTADPRHLRS
jgi:nucleoside-diphosphate-sugar epimerase